MGLLPRLRDFISQTSFFASRIGIIYADSMRFSWEHAIFILEISRLRARPKGFPIPLGILQYIHTNKHIWLNI